MKIYRTDIKYRLEFTIVNNFYFTIISNNYYLFPVTKVRLRLHVTGQLLNKNMIYDSLVQNILSLIHPEYFCTNEILEHVCF